MDSSSINSIQLPTTSHQQSQTPLHDACRTGSLAKVMATLRSSSRNPHVYNVDQAGRTALIWCILARNDLLCHALLNFSTIDVDHIPQDGNDAKLCATVTGNLTAMMRILQKSKRSINILTKGRPLLGWAAMLGNLDMLLLLVTTPGVDINMADVNGNTPLHIAACHKQTVAVHNLLTLPGINCDPVNREGVTPFMFACAKACEQIAHRLLSTGQVRVTAADNTGFTCLSAAAKGGSHSIVVALLALDEVDIHAVDNTGRTARQWAQHCGHITIANLIGAREGDTSIQLLGMFPLTPSSGPDEPWD